jgi:hypothetical protein
MRSLDLAGERHARWRAAAERAGCCLEQWMTQVLDDAAG